jgi:hypothetical protein
MTQRIRKGGAESLSDLPSDMEEAAMDQSFVVVRERSTAEREMEPRADIAG